MKEKKLIEDKHIAKDIMLLKSQAERCREILQKFSKNKEAKEIFTRPHGFSEGDILVQTNLANTLERISKNGKKEFYSGDTARKIANFFQMFIHFNWHGLFGSQFFCFVLNVCVIRPYCSQKKKANIKVSV